MNLPEILFASTTLIFGIASIILSVKEEKTRTKLLKIEKEQRQKLYQIEILRQIQDRIGYSLDIERVIDVIIAGLQDLFPYSSASSLYIKNGQIIFKTYLKETVSPDFVYRVKQSMLASLSALLDRRIDTSDRDFITGSPQDQTSNLLPQSFFHIPLVVNENIQGLISVASGKRGLYQENDMTILYKITNQASDTLSRLKDVIDTEQEKLMALIKSLVDGVFMVDVSGRLLVINKQARNLLGIITENPTAIDVLSMLPKDIEITSLIETAVSHNTPQNKKNIHFENRILDIFILPVTASGKVLGASVVMHDTTLEKNLTAMKEDFTNTIVHELKAPLVAIRGAAQLIEKPDSLNADEIIKFSHIISEQSDKLIAEISSILDEARIESGRFQLDKKSTDLNKLIIDQITLFKPEAARRGVKISTLLGNIPIVYIDATRINHVLNNLISNSLKFTPKDGAITVSSQFLGNLVKVSVADTGIGISKENQKDLFSKFSRIVNPASTSSHIRTGTGLGLYIAKGIVEAHAGQIRLESEKNKGTTVYFTLPISSI